MNERLKEFRKTLGASQAEFGNKIGLTASAISAIEKGKRGVTDQLIILLSIKFNVSEDWLKYDEGTMFKDKEYINIDQFGLNKDERDILTVFATLLEEDRRTIIKLAERFASIRK